MRQAGRYLPEYRELRAQHAFMDVVRDPALCTELALQPLRRFDLDATIVFSDILVLLDAIGAEVSFEAGAGPRLGRPLADAADASAYAWGGVAERVAYVYEAVSQLRAAAPGHAVIGFAGSPWTLFCYLVDGRGGGFPRAQAMAARDPGGTRAVLARLGALVSDHLRRQVAAGADVVQVFDTWGGLLSAADYESVAAPSLQEIASSLVAPSILFVRGTTPLLPAIRGLGFTALSVDAATDLGSIRGIPTQGNLDPEVLFAGPEAIAAGVRGILDRLAGRVDHVMNLGHGVLPTTPPEAVAQFVEACHS